MDIAGDGRQRKVIREIPAYLDLKYQMSQTFRNVLILITTQQRRDSLGCYGNTYTSTPNLDELASRGARFCRNYIANPMSQPNRLSLMSGRMPSNHGLWTCGLLLDPQPTLPGYLQEKGLSTASIGKIHFTPYGGRSKNMESVAFWREVGNDYDWNGPYWGFDHVELTIDKALPQAHYRRWFYANGGDDGMLERNPTTEIRPIPPRLHESTFVGERSCEYLRSRAADGKPFLLCASFTDPHNPFDPPQEIAEQYLPQHAPLPAGSASDLDTRPEHYRRYFRGQWHRGKNLDPQHPEGIDETTTRQRIANTAAMVDLIDRNIGRIMQTLYETHLDESTLVVFTSDHGELLGDHGLWHKGPFFYEGPITTPLLIAGPGIRQGNVIDALSSAIDLAPTVCELMGIETPAWCEGVSLVPLLTGDRPSVRQHCIIEYRNGFGNNDVASRTIVTQRMKYTRYQTGQEELTDLERDPNETVNIAAMPESKDEVMRLRTQLLDACLAGQSRYPDQIAQY